MTADTQTLLAQYAADGSETAFRELVERYIDFVYSTALRLLEGDTHRAKDVTQVVFINLARKARALSPKLMLGGWLHAHTFHVAMKFIRSERRRQTREREAMQMNDESTEAHWHSLAPLLDEAITQLAKEDRAAILLRFFEHRDFRAVGAAIGSSEDAARMRVNRALEKLQALLVHRGVALPLAALATALTTKTVIAAPIGLATAVSSTALAGAGSGGVVGILKLMAATKFKFGVTTIAIVGATALLLVQHQAQVRLRTENQALLQQINQHQIAIANLSNRLAQGRRITAPRIPAPLLQRSTAANVAPMETIGPTNLYAHLTNKASTLTAEQIAPYLQANNRSAASLLAGFRTTGDAALLEEAMQKFPHDPHVAFEAAIKKDMPAAERRRWLDALKQSAPDNPLADYLSANEYFRAGHTDKAIEELLRASGKKGFQDFTIDRIQNNEEAYRAAGYTVAEAKSVASTHLLLPYLEQARELAGSIVDLAGSYGQVGDETSRDAALQMAIGLGRHFSEHVSGPYLINEMVGIVVERIALEKMDPAMPFEGSGTVQDRIAQLAERRASIRGLVQQADSMWPRLSEADWVSYHSRSMVFGEIAALRWVVGKYSAQ